MNKKRLILKRVSSSPEVTMGVLICAATGLPIVLTLELPYLSNKPFISSIPTGVYTCTPYTSNTHKNVYEITGVTDRDKILIHVGNTVADIEGCIVVGLSYGTLIGKQAVLNSRAAMTILQDCMGCDDFLLEVF